MMLLFLQSKMDDLFAKIVVFTPVTHGEVVRKALAEAGAGHLGAYDFCSFSSKGLGRFRPLKGAKPFIGEVDSLEMVEEERIEVICPKNLVIKVVEAVKAVHPYEEPAIDIYPLQNLK